MLKEFALREEERLIDGMLEEDITLEEELLAYVGGLVSIREGGWMEGGGVQQEKRDLNKEDDMF